MKRSKNILATIVMLGAILFSASATRAGIIVGFGEESSDQAVCQQKSESKLDVKFDSGIIVGLTGIIVGLTGIIVGYVDSEPDCGYIPTSD